MVQLCGMFKSDLVIMTLIMTDYDKTEKTEISTQHTTELSSESFLFG